MLLQHCTLLILSYMYRCLFFVVVTVCTAAADTGGNCMYGCSRALAQKTDVPTPVVHADYVQSFVSLNECHTDCAEYKYHLVGCKQLT